MSRKLDVQVLLRATALFLIVAQLCHLVTQKKHQCQDLAFSFRHPNRTVTVTPAEPERRYGDLLSFTYHQNAEKVVLNNADCHLIISGVEGMARFDLQYLKPYLLKNVIGHSKAPHVVYIDWDANFIRRPWNRDVDIIVQSDPGPNTTNTGLMFFFNAKAQIPIIDIWIGKEIPGSQDQYTWKLTEQSVNFSFLRSSDGDYGENYNWNVINKPKTTVRCNHVIFHLTWFRLVVKLAILLAVMTKLYDLWSMEVKGYCRRRSYLSLLLIVSIACAVVFRENYHHHVANESMYESERICAIPEIGLRQEGTIVTRHGTSTAPNPFLSMGIAFFGLDRVATSLSFWFTLLAGLRGFARVMLLIEIISWVTSLCLRRSDRVESQLWCLYAQIRDPDKGKSTGFMSKKKHGDGWVRLVDEDVENAIVRRKGISPRNLETNGKT